MDRDRNTTGWSQLLWSCNNTLAQIVLCVQLGHISPCFSVLEGSKMTKQGAEIGASFKASKAVVSFSLSVTGACFLTVTECHTYPRILWTLGCQLE
eukprot:2280921-Rhodomonas_salina.1